MGASKGDALAAIVEWMGAYEGLDGIPMGRLLDERDPAEDDAFSAEQDVPRDMVAGYRLAVRQWQAYCREQAEAAAFRELRAKHPAASDARIRAAIRAAR